MFAPPSGCVHSVAFCIRVGSSDSGRYLAASIAHQCYGGDAPTVDSRAYYGGFVLRVLVRYLERAVAPHDERTGANARFAR